MDEETYQAVETEIGVIAGRDAIYLDDLSFDDSSRLTLRGAINGHLASAASAEWYDYSLKFRAILAFKVVEVDSWFHQPERRNRSSFDEVFHSTWPDELGGKAAKHDRHFIVATYDYVIEVLCHEFELKITALE